MSLLQSSITYQQVVDAGALKLYAERHVKRWFGGKPELTLEEALSITTHPIHIFWAVMRERHLPAGVIHQLAVDIGREFLARADGQGVYVDFRSRRVLDAKQRYVDGEISLGALLVAKRKAEQARADVAELDDPRVSAAAHIVCEAGGEDAEEAFTQTFYTFDSVYGRREDQRWLIRQARSRLSTWGTGRAGEPEAAEAAEAVRHG
jgi:hypothetical protein